MSRIIDSASLCQMGTLSSTNQSLVYDAILACKDFTTDELVSALTVSRRIMNVLQEKIHLICNETLIRYTRFRKEIYPSWKFTISRPSIRKLVSICDYGDGDRRTITIDLLKNIGWEVFELSRVS